MKASGLAAGKGVIVAKNKEEACKAVREIMQVGDASEGFALHVNKCCKFTKWVPNVPTHWKVGFHCTVCYPFLENG